MATKPRTGSSASKPRTPGADIEAPGACSLHSVVEANELSFEARRALQELDSEKAQQIIEEIKHDSSLPVDFANEYVICALHYQKEQENKPKDHEEQQSLCDLASRQAIGKAFNLKRRVNDGKTQERVEASRSKRRSQRPSQSTDAEASTDVCQEPEESEQEPDDEVAAQIKLERAMLSVGLEDRLAPSGAVPFFHTHARGTPHEWNSVADKFCWGSLQQKHMQIPVVDVAAVDVAKVMEFFCARFGPDGQAIRDKIGAPEAQDGSWFKCPWREFSEAELPTVTEGPFGDGFAEWMQAWHGCKFEALYSIMYRGRLLESSDAERGDLFFERAPGVHVHRDWTLHKTDNDVRFVPLCRDGVFWSSTWEVRVDRSDRVPVRNTDRWVQRARSVRLVALWLCSRTAETFEVGDEFSAVWDPLLEANPLTDAQIRLFGSIDLV